MFLKCIAMLSFCSLVSLAMAQRQTSDWNDYGGTLAGQHYSGRAQIRKDNVAGLQVAWVFHTHTFDTPSQKSNARASAEATPVLWNNTLYFDTPFDTVFAVDAATGKQRWSFDPHVDREGTINILTSRGVALWHAKRPGRGVCGSDRVLLATVDRRLIALDAATGVPCPDFGIAGTVDLSRGNEIAKKDYYEFTSPATVVGDTVVLGSTVGDNIFTFIASGAVRGFDALTGKQKWAWEPLRAGAGQERAVGSGNAWSVLSADTEHDLLFVPTGSASVDFFGGTRPGDNRDADSLVALQASTGKRVWAFQLVHHDLWDYDTPSEPVLFTFRGTIPAVAVTTKTSMVYVFNRLTGEPLYPIEERPVPASSLPGEQAWPTQPFSTLPPLTPLTFSVADVRMKNAADQKYCVDLLNSLEYKGIFTPPSKKGSVIYPGPIGGANWGSSAFDPTTAVLYTRVNNMPFLVRQQKRYPYGKGPVKAAEQWWASNAPVWAGGMLPPLSGQFHTPDSGLEQRDESVQLGTPYTLARQGLMTTGEVPCGPEPFGSIVAMNLDTGKVLWTVPHGEMAQGYAGSIGVAGVIATAGGLLFAASTNDSLLRAYDSQSGRELWRAALPAPAHATPMTYEAGGRQYVVIVAGGHGFIGKGKSDEVIAYALPSIPKAKAGHR